MYSPVWFFVMFSGGHDGKTQLRDVWMSADNGGSWTMIAASAPWHSRQGHSIAVSKDHIYMMGGFGGAQRFNDCWKTADGGTYGIHALSLPPVLLTELT